jgi:nitroreductase
VTRNDDVLEVLSTARSMRWLRPDPVEPELIERVVWAGTRASSPNNTQAWDFVVVTSPEVKAGIQEAMLGKTGISPDAVPLPEDPVQRRTAQGAMNLLRTMGSVPALIFVCGTNSYPDGAPAIEFAYSAMFAAAQNMLVAARALGLGAAFTTFHRSAEPQIRKLLGIPDDRIIGVTLPLGWPARPFGPVTRRPVSEVIHHDGW